VTTSALQSRKWQLIGMSQWCRSALYGHPLPALTDNWTHGAASRHTTSHTRPSPRSRSYYSFPVPLRVGGWVRLNLFISSSTPCLPRTSSWFSSFHCHHSAASNPVSIILTFQMSKPSHSTFLNHQTDRFNPNSYLSSALFFLSFKVKCVEMCLLIKTWQSHIKQHRN